jgi:hypothetical protein
VGHGAVTSKIKMGTITAWVNRRYAWGCNTVNTADVVWMYVVNDSNYKKGIRRWQKIYSNKLEIRSRIMRQL